LRDGGERGSRNCEEEGRIDLTKYHLKCVMHVEAWSTEGYDVMDHTPVDVIYFVNVDDAGRDEIERMWTRRFARTKYMLEWKRVYCRCHGEFAVKRGKLPLSDWLKWETFVDA
jgi:hypothetical protein